MKLAKCKTHGWDAGGDPCPRCELYLRWDPFAADMDRDVRAETVSMVLTRDRQVCVPPGVPGGQSEPHEFHDQTLARRDKAIVDGEWRTVYTCHECLDEWVEWMESIGAL